MRTRKLAAGLAALAMVALAACGSDTKSSSATNAPAAPAATTAAPADTAAPRRDHRSGGHDAATDRRRHGYGWRAAPVAQRW